MSLLPLYRDMAAGGQQFRGHNIEQFREVLRAIVKEHGIETMLDYGCGAGDQYRSPVKLHDHLGLKRHNVALYDPSFAHSKPPTGKFDLVVCSDVLEHVPEADVPVFVERLFRHARKHVWASVCCRPAKKFFPDGKNLHVTLQPLGWWLAWFQDSSRMHGVTCSLVETP